MKLKQHQDWVEFLSFYIDDPQLSIEDGITLLIGPDLPNDGMFPRY